ncbi:MAG: MGMT family protein [Aeropyrum sp.]|nr:MGMT family protein [Aeropyrum sp.]
MPPGEEAILAQLVYTLVQTVPQGRVTTYGSIAKLLNTSPRVIGRILASNDNPIVVPCHRVVRSDGGLGGYSFGGETFKAKLLMLEGVRVYRVGDRFYVGREHIIDLNRILSPKPLL